MAFKIYKGADKRVSEKDIFIRFTNDGTIYLSSGFISAAARALGGDTPTHVQVLFDEGDRRIALRPVAGGAPDPSGGYRKISTSKVKIISVKGMREQHKIEAGERIILGLTEDPDNGSIFASGPLTSEGEGGSS